MRNFDLSPLFRSTVGFDQLDKLLDSALRDSARENSYPPYNIAKLGQDKYRITMAVAGFAEEDLDITAHENMPIVKGQIAKADQNVEFLHRGIAQRAFEHRFQLADHVRVDGASLERGLLSIELRREVPDAMKPRKVQIGGAKRPTVIETSASDAA